MTAVDILPDPQIRQELSALSGWPTIPQVFVRGELVGGADIVEELEASGELEQTLREKLGESYGGAEREPSPDGVGPEGVSWRCSAVERAPRPTVVKPQLIRT